MPFFRNPFSKFAHQPEFQYPHRGFSETRSTSTSSRSTDPSPSAHVPQGYPQRFLSNQVGPAPPGGTIINYDERSDSSSLLTEGVFLPEANQIPAVYRPPSDEFNHLHRYQNRVVPPLPVIQRRNSSEYTSSTSSASQPRNITNFSEHHELPPRVIQEPHSTSYLERASQYVPETRYTRSSEVRTHDRGSSRSHRQRKHTSNSKTPVILLFENERGGYDNIWYIAPGKTPVVFKDTNGNEITRVGGHSSHSSSSRTPPPPLLMNQYGHRLHQHSEIPGDHEIGRQRHSSPGSSTPSVTFINMQSSRRPQQRYIEPTRIPYPSNSNSLYIDPRRASSTSIPNY